MTVFRIGQKVAMIAGAKGSYNPQYRCEGWPAEIHERAVYTVRDVDTRAAKYGWPVVLRFEEFVAEARDTLDLGLWEPGFAGDLFRPVIDRETDISIFKAMLQPNTVREKAPAQ